MRGGRHEAVRAFLGWEWGARDPLAERSFIAPSGCVPSVPAPLRVPTPSNVCSPWLTCPQDPHSSMCSVEAAQGVSCAQV
jgi:hypothetical protein